MPDRRVVVTGLGILSPVGNEIELSWKNLLEGLTPVKEISYIDTSN